MQGSPTVANEANPQNRVVAETTSFDLYFSGAPTAAMSADGITPVGGGGSHTNIMPFLCLNFIIALFGIFPSRN